MKIDKEYLRKKKNRLALKVIGILAAVLIVGLLWYFLFFENMQSQIASLKTQVAEAEDFLAIENQKAVTKKAMQKVVNDESIQTYIPSYGNETMLTEFKFLNMTIAEAERYNITFAEPVTDNRISVRREMNISFDSSNYTEAKKILNKVEDGEIRSLIKDIKINSTDSGRSASRGFADNVPVTTTATLVFFETTVGAESTEGLVVNAAQTIEEETEDSIYE